MSPAEALAFIIKMNMTVRNYRLMRENAIDKGHDIYPSYDAVDAMKKLCMPEDVQFSETEAKVSMESLLNHRMSRVLALNPDMMDEMNRIAGQNYTARFIFYYKYGCGKYFKLRHILALPIWIQNCTDSIIHSSSDIKESMFRMKQSMFH